MSAESKQTMDHKEIRQWVEARNGVPATVKRTERGDEAGILRIMFRENQSGDALEEISWDEFFAKFEDSKLAFLYQEETKDGGQSRFFKFVKR